MQALPRLAHHQPDAMRQVAQRGQTQVLVERGQVVIEAWPNNISLDEASVRWLQLVALPAALATLKHAPSEQIPGQTQIA